MKLAFVFATVSLFGQLKTDNTDYRGTDLPPGFAVLTFDDGIAGKTQSGRTQTELLGEMLASRGIMAVFFQVGCHNDVPNPPKRDPMSSMCMNGDTHPLSITLGLLAEGHVIGNHTWFHIPLTTIKSDPGRILAGVRLFQDFLVINRLQPDGLQLFRAPGLSFDSTVGQILNSDPHLKRLIGPFGVDTDAIGISGGILYGGDFDWYAKGKTAEECAQFYYQQVKQVCAIHGCVILIHERTELEITADWGYRVTQRLLELMGADYTFVPPDAIPGILGNLQIGPLKQWTPEFGDDDGMGSIILGDISGIKKMAACKVRLDHRVWCGVPGTADDGTPALKTATPWLAIDDSEWKFAYDHRFWLADIDGDLKDDLIFLNSQGVWVAFSNGKDGFGPPQLWSALPGGLDNRKLLDGIRFGNFCNKRPISKDLLIATPGRIMVLRNFADGFGIPFIWSSDIPITADISTLQVADIDGDGFDDIMVRDLALGKIFTAITYAGGLFGGQRFKPAKVWMTFTGQKNPSPWSDPGNGNTLRLARIDRTLLLTAGAPTGIAYTPVLISTDPEKSGFGPGWRHLCNTCATTLVGWHPERNASGYAWGNLDGNLNDSLVLTRPHGLEIAPGKRLE